MSLLKRRPDDNDPPPSGPPSAAPHQQSGIIKSGSITHTQMPVDDTPAPAPEPGGVRFVGDPSAAPPRQANPLTTSGGGASAPAATPRPQAAVNAQAEKAIMERANAEAAALVKDAMEKTEALKKKVQAELESAMEANNLRCQEQFEQAYQDGFARGQTEGVDTARQEFQAVMQEAQSVLSQAIQGREALIKSATGEIAKIALRVAEKVIGHEVNVNEDVIIGTVKLALEKIKARESVTVRCNPTDVEYVKMNKHIFERMVEGLKTFDVQSDAKVDRGGCILETNLGNVDARIQTQLAVLHQAFDEVERMTEADAPAGEPGES